VGSLVDHGAPLPAPAILVVVAAPGLRSTIAAVLTNGGYRCEQAGDVTEAVDALARASRFTVAICDLDLEDHGSLIDRIRREYPGTAIATVRGGVDGRRADVPDPLSHLSDPRNPRRLLTGVMTAIRHHADVRADEDRQHLMRAVVESQIEQLGALAPELAATRCATLARLALAIDARHAEPNDHVDRLTLLVTRIAQRLGLPAHEVSKLAAAAPLHDLGKLAIPASLLAKPGRFTAEERRAMERHAELGHAMLAGTGDEVLELAATIAWTHHERWNGCGYPRGLRGEQTPLPGRIVGIATVFDALTSDRIYRRALPVAEALQVIRGGSGTDFDPAVAAALIAVVDKPGERADPRAEPPQAIAPDRPAPQHA